MKEPTKEDARAVIKVGGGRGFIIQYRRELPPVEAAVLRKITRAARGKRCFFVDERLVVTAAHCLPLLPPCHPSSYTYERTYRDLLGRLEAPKTHVWAECLFADPVADIAVLGCPDRQELPNRPMPMMP